MDIICIHTICAAIKEESVTGKQRLPANSSHPTHHVTVVLNRVDKLTLPCSSCMYVQNLRKITVIDLMKK